MEMPLAGWGKVLHYEQEIAAADHPDIRLFQIKKQLRLRPPRKYNLLWTVGSLVPLKR